MRILIFSIAIIRFVIYNSIISRIGFYLHAIKYPFACLEPPLLAESEVESMEETAWTNALREMQEAVSNFFGTIGEAMGLIADAFPR